MGFGIRGAELRGGGELVVVAVSRGGELQETHSVPF